METLKYNLYIPDHNNGFRKEYDLLMVDENAFNMDWIAIMNSMPSNYIRGRNQVDAQLYMQDHGIRFIAKSLGWSENRVDDYINASEINTRRSKKVEHHNSGNY